MRRFVTNFQSPFAYHSSVPLHASLTAALGVTHRPSTLSLSLTSPTSSWLVVSSMHYTTKGARSASKLTSTSKKEAVTKKGKTDASKTISTSPSAALKESAAKTVKVESSSSSSSSSASSSAAPTLDMSDKKAEVVFSFDTTGSMYPCLTQVRRDISNCVDRLFRDIGPDNLRIGITAHGDYCDADSSYVTKHLPLTNKKAEIVDFVQSVGNTGGGDPAECYELVLHEAQSYAWTKGWNKALVMIGDELPHEPSYPLNKLKLNWRSECDQLSMKGIQVHGVQALSRKHASSFYSEIAAKTNGVHVPLDQFNSITDLVLAVCLREARPSALEAFEKEVQAGGRYSRGMQTAFDKMLGRDRSKIGGGDDAPTAMHAVSPGRFQVLKVDKDCSIKDFVQSQGVTFKIGRGFYEFTKPEIIQDRKEIVLMDPKTGDIFEGDYARTLINAPRGMGNKRVAPGDIDFIPFIQSTSATRKLVGGTRFLYEITEGF